MKKIMMIIALLGIASLLIFVKNPEEEKTEALASIYDNVLLKDSGSAQKQCRSWQQLLGKAQPGERNEQLDTAFRELLMAWKQVEANYIAGDLQADVIDTPRFIDIFHVGNEKIIFQMNKVINSNSEAKTALYKHSYKTVNALEALLYQDDKLSERELELAAVVSENICHRLDQIHKAYTDKREAFLADSEKALSLLINILAERSFEMKDWRVGDPAGLTKKYENSPDPARGEYALSGLSMPAVAAILSAQEKLIAPQDYANLRQIVALLDAEKPLNTSAELLSEAQKKTKALIKQKDFAFSPQQTKPLYDLLNRLQSSYYSNLLEALNVTAKILEADGD